MLCMGDVILLQNIEFGEKKCTAVLVGRRGLLSSAIFWRVRGARNYRKHQRYSSSSSQGFLFLAGISAG